MNKEKGKLPANPKLCFLASSTCFVGPCLGRLVSIGGTLLWKFMLLCLTCETDMAQTAAGQGNTLPLLCTQRSGDSIAMRSSALSCETLSCKQQLQPLKSAKSLRIPEARGEAAPRFDGGTDPSEVLSWSQVPRSTPPAWSISPR